MPTTPPAGAASATPTQAPMPTTPPAGAASATPTQAPMPAGLVVLALSLLLGLQPVTTDLYLPALPGLTHDLGASMAQAQRTLTALLLAFGVSQLVGAAVGPAGPPPGAAAGSGRLRAGVGRWCARHRHAHPDRLACAAGRCHGRRCGVCACHACATCTARRKVPR